MDFHLVILGAGSAAPVYNRHHSAQVLFHNGNYFLIDCGEGTQLQLARYKIGLNRIQYIFISHLHGDHYLGLAGLLSSMHLFGRQNPVYIYGPPGLSEIITTQLYYSGTVLNYDICFTELDNEENSKQILDLPDITVSTLPLQHRITCNGFLFREKERPRKIDKKVMPDDISVDSINTLKAGSDVYDVSGNLLYKNKNYTLAPHPPRSYAYCSDTLYNEALIPYLKDVNLLYHEATFMHNLEERAAYTFHTTARQAGTLARKANAGQLIIGHYSTRYKDIDPLLEEARESFPDTEAAAEGKKYPIE